MTKVTCHNSECAHHDADKQGCTAGEIVIDIPLSTDEKTCCITFIDHEE